VKFLVLAAAALLTVGISGCADGGSARPVPEGSSAPPALVENGIVVNELDVIEGAEPRKTTSAVASLGGIVISCNERLGTCQVRFHTHSLAELTRIKKALAAEQISANLVFAHAPLP
jgi:hypothetical protein